MTERNTNKVILNGETLIDLTGDTVTASDVINGKSFHDKSGAKLTGTSTFDADTSDATATASEILASKTAYASGSKLEGTMVNNGSVSGSIATKDAEYSIPAGYHDGGGKVAIDATEKSKLVASNIREGITLLGIEGSMSGTEDVSAEAVSVTPSSVQQVVTPSAGHNYLSQVTVAPIPYAETDNAAGGKTVTIGAAS